jgi:hypothetical protein
MNDTRDFYKLFRELESQHQVNDTIGLHDSFDLELNEHFVIETGVVGLTKDGGVIIQLDEEALQFLDFNGMINESEELSESALNEGSSQGVEDAIRWRILRQHPDVVRKFGPVRIMAAIEERASELNDLEEIGSSDVSIWTKQVIDALEAGYYDDMDSVPVRRDVTETEDSDIFAKIVKSDDPFQTVYDGISGHFGEEARKKLQAIYDDVVIDNHGILHPDDDFEKIIDIMLDHIEADYGEGGPQKPYYTASDDELNEIKRLALGHREDELDEGWKSWVLGGAALLAAILGGNKLEYENQLKNDPQLAKLVQFRQQAEKSGDTEKMKELDDRIKQTYDHLEVTGSEVMGDDGRPVDPVYEAEYHGRKVPLGKPMQGDVKKSKVYVKKPNGKVVKVNFGDKNMRIKKSSPSHRKSFRARHHCENPGPRWKARYWSCRAW